MQDPDDVLMMKVKSGDDEAFELLVARYSKEMMNFFYRYLQDAQEAEDMAQEAFMRIYEHSWDYLPRGHFRGWLYTIGYNLCNDLWRREHLQGKFFLRSMARIGREQNVSVEGAIVAGGSDPADCANRAEVVSCVKRAVGSLPDNLRLVLVMKQYQGLSFAEIAAILDCPVGSVKSRMHRALDRLRKHLGEQGISFEDI